MKIKKNNGLYSCGLQLLLEAPLLCCSKRERGPRGGGSGGACDQEVMWPQRLSVDDSSLLAASSLASLVAAIRLLKGVKLLLKS